MQLICNMMSFRATHRHRSENPLQCDFYCFYLQWEQKKTVAFPAENISAGKIGYQIDLDPQTLIEFTKGKCADIIK